MAKDMQPLNIVEKPGFTYLVSKLDPKYELPSRKYFTLQEIPRLYSEVKDDLFAKLKDAEFFAATTDLWTSGANLLTLATPFTSLHVTGHWSHFVSTLY